MKKWLMKKQYLFFLLLPFIAFGQSLSSDKNAVVQSSFRMATTNPADGSDPSKALITIQYSDGIGRPLQSVGYQQNPSQQDISLSTTAYDAFGRPISTALPSPAGLATGGFQVNALANANTFYGDNRSFTEITAFDNSPLNRPREQYGAGQSWKTAASDFIKKL